MIWSCLSMYYPGTRSTTMRNATVQSPRRKSKVKMQGEITCDLSTGTSSQVSYCGVADVLQWHLSGQTKKSDRNLLSV